MWPPATLRRIAAAERRTAPGLRALARAAAACAAAVVTGYRRSGARFAVSRARAGAAAFHVEPLPGAFRLVSGKLRLQRTPCGARILACENRHQMRRIERRANPIYVRGGEICTKIKEKKKKYPE